MSLGLHLLANFECEHMPPIFSNKVCILKDTLLCQFGIRAMIKNDSLAIFFSKGDNHIIERNS